MVQSRYCGNNLETNAGGQAEMFRNVVRGDTRIFSPLAVAGLCVTIGPAEGEHLIRNAGSYIIKVDPKQGFAQHGPGNTAGADPYRPKSISIRKQMRCCSFSKAPGLGYWATHA